MFNKTQEQFESINRQLKWEHEFHSDRFWKLQHQISMLIDYLGVVESQPEKSKFVKKEKKDV